jgi:hypothetical protein
MCAGTLSGIPSFLFQTFGKKKMIQEIVLVTPQLDVYTWFTLHGTQYV